MQNISHKLLDHFNIPRIFSSVKNTVKDFDVNLNGLNVLTEAASGYYMLTPIIAALAGAKNVYALTKDSQYGRAVDIAEATKLLANHWEVGERIKVLFSREDSEIAKADIITNLGHVRPLNKNFLSKLKSTAVIPLMWEAWEYRPEDIDLSECRRLGIPVLATNEESPSLKIFNYIGYLAIKLLFELDIEVFRSKIVVIGSGKFGDKTIEALKNAGSCAIYLKPEDLETSTQSQIYQILKECDAIVLVEHIYKKQLIGPHGFISANVLHDLNPGIVFVHITGNIDEIDVKSSGIFHRPEKFANAGYMSVTTEYLGPRPLIALHTAGLKIGEVLSRARLAGYDRNSSIEKALKLEFAQLIN